MAVADFNNDGLLDLFICSYHNGRETRHRLLPLLETAPGAASLPTTARASSHTPHPAVSPPTSTATAGSIWPSPTTRWKATTSAIQLSGGTAPKASAPSALPRCPTSGPHGMTAVSPHSIADRGTEEFYLSAPLRTARRRPRDRNSMGGGDAAAHLGQSPTAIRQLGRRSGGCALAGSRRRSNLVRKTPGRRRPEPARPMGTVQARPRRPQCMRHTPRHRSGCVLRFASATVNRPHRAQHDSVAA